MSLLWLDVFFDAVIVMSIKENLSAVRRNIPDGVKLVCVSKFHPAEAVSEAYAVGERCFAESRPQEFVPKAEGLPGDIEWHFIGNLQTNKVKMVVPHASLIHSVANERLVGEIERCAARTGKVQDILVELHVAREDTKQGFSPEEALALFTPDFLGGHPHVRVCGVMGMASLVADEVQIRNEFRRIRSVFEQLKSTVFAGSDTFAEISMGMSHDYRIAIEEGSTMVRIGTAIFGERVY